MKNAQKSKRLQMNFHAKTPFSVLFCFRLALSAPVNTHNHPFSVISGIKRGLYSSPSVMSV